jgi:hypothetical protein
MDPALVARQMRDGMLPFAVHRELVPPSSSTKPISI